MKLLTAEQAATRIAERRTHRANLTVTRAQITASKTSKS